MTRSSAKPSFVSHLGRWTAWGCIAMLVLVTAMEVVVIWRDVGVSYESSNRSVMCGFARWAVFIESTLQCGGGSGFVGFAVPRLFRQNLVKLEWVSTPNIGMYVRIPFWLLNCVLLPFPIARWLWRWRRRKLAAAQP
jgi:hypothetical protein